MTGVMRQPGTLAGPQQDQDDHDDKKGTPMGLMNDMNEARLEGIDAEQTAKLFRAVAALTPEQLRGMLGWAQMGQDSPVYRVAYALLEWPEPEPFQEWPEPLGGADTGQPENTMSTWNNEDLTAGMMDIHVYYLSCGCVTWMSVPPAEPPRSCYCRRCGGDVTIMSYQADLVPDLLASPAPRTAA